MTRVQPSLDERLAKYEGLVHRTTFMFAGRANMDEEDFAQELRLKVWWALERWDPARSRLPEKRYVYSIMFNRVKDLIRYPRQHFFLFDDLAPDGRDASPDRPPARDRFDMKFLSTSASLVEEALDGQGLLPESLSSREKTVLVLLYLEYQQAEIAPLMGCGLTTVKLTVRALREKLSHLEPGRPATVFALPALVSPERQRVAA